LPVPNEVCRYLGGLLKGWHPEGAMECGSEAAALGFERTAGAGAAALHGAFGTGIF